MKYHDWNESKNDSLKKERDVCFEDVLIALDEGRVYEIIEHPNTKRYPNQKMYIVEIREYVYLVPFVEDEEKIFLKTIIPSRRATKNYQLKVKK